MISDLDKYGLVALTVIIVLILFIAISDLRNDSDPGLNGIVFDDGVLAAADRNGEDGGVVMIRDTGSLPAPSGDFDFAEGPVEYPGSPGEREAVVPGGGDGFTIHRVEKGEILSSISRKYYGTVTRWRGIVEANPGLDPMHLSVGQRLRIPLDGPAVEGGREERSRPAAPAARESSIRYRVCRGDTLGKIARKFYGSEAQWEKIRLANKEAIPDPKRLQIGVLLEIPR